jgi:hypothetical protein
MFSAIIKAYFAGVMSMQAKMWLVLKPNTGV